MRDVKIKVVEINPGKVEDIRLNNMSEGKFCQEINSPIESQIKTKPKSKKKPIKSTKSKRLKSRKN